jgi:hypothetical protein
MTDSKTTAYIGVHVCISLLLRNVRNYTYCYSATDDDDDEVDGLVINTLKYTDSVG